MKTLGAVTVMEPYSWQMPEIEKLRADFCRRHNRPLQRVVEPQWLVAVHGPVHMVVACVSWFDGLEKERYVLDGYCVPGRWGVVGFYALYKELEARAIGDKVRLVLMTHPTNASFIASACRKGYVPTDLILAKDFR